MHDSRFSVAGFVAGVGAGFSVCWFGFLYMNVSYSFFDGRVKKREKHIEDIYINTHRNDTRIFVMK